ncbi:MAG: hypothetical protein CME26_01255 [Gemmatimonadetes bacterium]|nr:hypothetical protein [Gemmatimonadota bacterium]|tara:strand:- start:7664 stop:7861 length:198 start_codon:yes stop_codon:yes gene_type:complete
MEGVYTFRIDDEECQVTVSNYCATHWEVYATNVDGVIGEPVHLKKTRYRTKSEAAERAIRHFREC